MSLGRFGKFEILGALAIGLAIWSCGKNNSGSTSAQSLPPATQATGQPAAVPAVRVDIPSGAMVLGAAAFGTNPLVVTQGTEVTWVNNDTVAHTVTSDTSVFDSGQIPAGQSYMRAFTALGDFPYFCSLHGKQSMSGMVRVVSPSSQPTPSPSSPST